MSSQRGNVVRTRPQKHKNKRVFKNDLHDTNIRTKRINQIQIAHVCQKCKAVLEWKIKYKKYKLIKAARSCNKCGDKTVKQPYHTVCQPCAQKLVVCPKCEAPMSRNNEENNEESTPDINALNSNDDDCNDESNDSEMNSDNDDDFSELDEACMDKISRIKLKS